MATTIRSRFGMTAYVHFMDCGNLVATTATPWGRLAITTVFVFKAITPPVIRSPSMATSMRSDTNCDDVRDPVWPPLSITSVCNEGVCRGFSFTKDLRSA